MKQIAIINGPNLNLIGRREPALYGSTTMEDVVEQLRRQFPEVALHYYQSNVEGELVDAIQRYGYSADALIVNFGGYSHTSVALRDALLAVPADKVEVHISNIFAREEYRHHSLVSSACRGMIAGLGVEGYALAVASIVHCLPCGQ